MSMNHRIVIALGGNALGNTLPEQMKAVKITSQAIVDLIEEGNQVIISHGNGPQVGMIHNAMSALAREDIHQPNTPLSVCVAMSQAYIGYDLQNALREELLNRNLSHIPVTTMITQMCVDPNDEAFTHPSKPIGRYLSEDEANACIKNYDYEVKYYPGHGYRRIVASPKPKTIIEIDAIRTLVDSGQVVIACGGGGIPVVLKGNHLKGTSAVIDKDFASCLLAKELHADHLFILTAVDKVAIHYNTPNVQWLDKLTTEYAKELIQANEFEAGSMLPKVQAAIEFAESAPDRVALITNLIKAKEALKGNTGTRIYQSKIV